MVQEATIGLAGGARWRSPKGWDATHCVTKKHVAVVLAATVYRSL